MRRVWLIRAGEQAEVIDPMRIAGLIGLRLETLTDVRQMSPEEIEKLITVEGHPGQVASLRAIAQWFANDITLGDLVVSPNPARHEVWLGLVSGGYEYSAEAQIAHYQHTRRVDWLGWLDRDAVWMRDQLKSIERPVRMVELYNRDWWWNHVGTAALSLTPRAGTVRASRAASTRTPSAPRAPRAPRPSANPRPKVIPPVLCAGSCGLVWSPYVLVDGLCADCRNN
ncbi:MAG: hypothetical protein JWN62_1692 [Acidimicrobiales bacterium]|nr:hypothetical protein [Acidimicrobiales bacterium]